MGKIRENIQPLDMKNLETQLRALGCTDHLDSFLNPKDAVYKQYVEYWKKNRKAPDQEQIARILKMSPSRVSDRCRELERDGRMIYTTKGWVPVVAPKKS